MKITLNKTELAGALAALGKLVSRRSIVKAYQAIQIEGRANLLYFRTRNVVEGIEFKMTADLEDDFSAVLVEFEQFRLAVRNCKKKTLDLAVENDEVFIEDVKLALVNGCFPISDDIPDQDTNYDEEIGVWSMMAPAELNDVIVQTARHYGVMTGHDELVSKMTEPVCNHIRRFMRESKVDPFKTRPRNVVHAANGMVEISKDGTCTLKPYDRKYYSKTRCNIAYNPTAQCPRFINELLKPMLETEDDLNSMLLYGAQCVLPDNDIQKFLVINGTPGGGKDTFVNIIRSIIGDESCSELRKGKLGDRFEMGSFIDCSLLLGNDVDRDFLMCKDAGAVKKLCGGNLVEAEIKGVTKRFKLEGLFKIIITSNNRLKVRVDDDMGAWGRRMLVVPFVGKKPEKPISNFDEVLIAEEGEGILNLLIQKAAELIQHGFPMESLAHTRALRILQESDTIYGFLSACVEKVDSGAGITQEDLVEQYKTWCQSNDSAPLLGNEMKQKLRMGMESIFHVVQVNDIGSQRGYHGVAFKETPPTA